MVLGFLLAVPLDRSMRGAGLLRSFIIIPVFISPVALQKTIDVYNVLWDSLSAGAVIQLLPMVLVVFLLQRHIARGLALGAVK